MNIKIIALTSLLLLASAYTCAAQGVGKVGPAKPKGSVGTKDVPNKLPPEAKKGTALSDLYADASAVMCYNGSARVEFENKSDTNINRSFVVRLKVYSGSRLLDSTDRVVPGLAGRGSKTIKFSSDKITYYYSKDPQLTCAIELDARKQIEEAREDNNVVLKNAPAEDKTKEPND